MKKLFVLVVVSIVLVLGLAACGGNDQGGGGGAAATTEEGGLTGTLRIWSFTPEAHVQALAFQSMHPGVEIDFQLTGIDGTTYQDWVMTSLAAGGSGVPDIIFLEASHARLFVEGPFLADLSHLLPLAREIETYQFTIDMGTYAGEVRAFSWQATPGVMYFRRSLALEFFGTDDPDQLQNYFRDMDTFMDSARRIRDMSGGTAFVVGSAAEFDNIFLANRTSPWIVDNRLVICPIMMDKFTFSRTLREEGLEARIDTWSDGWFASMIDNFHDMDGNQNHVFAYLLPTWGLTHVIQGNAAQTSGDWGIIPGPMPYFGGGTWMGVTRASNNPELAEAFIRYTVLNEQFLTNWALGVYTNEYLAAVDPSIPAGLFQGGGDFVSSDRVVRALTPEFNTGAAVDFLGGQNPYAAFAQVAGNVDLSRIQGTDGLIAEAFFAARDLYVDGLATIEEALQSFKDSLSMSIPTLDW